MSEQARFCDCYHPDCTICKIEDIRAKELAATKQKLADTERLLNMSKESEECHAFNARTANAAYVEADKKIRALEAERKELEKQEPVPGDYVFCPEYDETPHGMVVSGGAYIPANALEIAEGLSCKLYASPKPPADVAELQKRVDELEARIADESGQTMNAVRFGQDMVKKYSDVCQELAKIKNVAGCGTAENFLKCDDETKRKYFAMMVMESTRVKRLTEENAELTKKLAEANELRAMAAELRGETK